MKSSPASRLLSSARDNRRSGVPNVAGGGKARQFTLDRAKAKEIAEQALSQALAEFLQAETSSHFESDDLLQELANGVVLCKLAARFGQVVRFKNPPANEFQRLENFRLFSTACTDMKLGAAAPTGRLPMKMSEVLPCVLALAALAERNASLQPPASAAPLYDAPASAPEPSVSQIAESEPEIPSSLPDSPKVIDHAKSRRSDTDYQADEESEGDDIEDMNSVLRGLHDLRMTRQRQAPPKIRLVNIGAQQLLVVERPGESVGSILWQGATVLASVLSEKTPEEEFSKPDVKILELGAGVGLVGIWAACKGADVVVTELEGNSLDLLWSNVAANAQAIVKAGGACSARALDFKDVYVGQRLMTGFGEDAQVIVVAADVLYNETVEPLTNLVAGLFAVRKNMVFYLAYKPRAAESEQAFFKRLESEHRVKFELLATRDEHQCFKGVVVREE